MPLVDGIAPKMARCTIGYKIFLFAVYAVAYSILYLLPNLRPPIAPSMLPLSALDHWVPFLPWTFAIYVSDYIMILSVILLITQVDEFNSFARQVFGVLLFCGVIFLFFPTTYPRPVYPEVANPLVSFAMNLVGTFDTPNNCFPSHHVAVTSIGAWCVRNRPRLLKLYSFWAVAIFLSTLTTKQHYAVDILGGLGVAAVVVILEHRLFLRKMLPSRATATSRPR